MKIWFTLIVVFLLTACSSSPVEKIEAPKPVSVALNYAVDGAQGLNVSILLFDTQDAVQVSRIYQPVRNAEAAYLPVSLRNTLNETGYWGAVSVVPTLDTASEVFVTGRIIESNAVELAMQFKVFDSRGVVWINREYRDYALPESYELNIKASEDPFQDLFNQLANDMSEFMLGMTSAEQNALLDTAMLRYAILLSPEAFGDYLVENESGHLQLAGLPAYNDPLYNKVRIIRGREFAIQDVVDDHFENFYADMQRVYPFWRQSSYELLAYNNQLDVGNSRASRQSWAEVERVYRLYKERKLNEDELRELASSFEREIDPTVAELEGRVIEIQGSLLTQYVTWRRILREIYAQTTENTPLIQTP